MKKSNLIAALVVFGTFSAGAALAGSGYGLFVKDPNNQGFYHAASIPNQFDCQQLAKWINATPVATVTPTPIATPTASPGASPTDTPSPMPTIAGNSPLQAYEKCPLANDVNE
jgi:hypothetical protein